MVKVTWLFTCDICGKEITKTFDSELYYDPVIEPPNGWDAVFQVPIKYRNHSNDGICDACPDCIKSPDWNSYLRGRS